MKMPVPVSALGIPSLGMPTLRGDYAAFTAFAVNHHKAPVEVREKFALPAGQQAALLAGGQTLGIASQLFVSTCNRAEYYVQTDRPELALGHFLQTAGVPHALFLEHGTTLRGAEALYQLFAVTAGLDAQVLGDVQVSRQVKDAYELANTLGAVGSAFHRLMARALKAHKRIRRETDLGSGAASIGTAAVHFVQETAGSLTDKHVLLVGAGKIGTVAARNLVREGCASLTVLNRSATRAETLVDELACQTAPFEQLAAQVAVADVVIVATGAEAPLLTLEHVQCPVVGPKILVDLAVPRNIAPEVGELPNVRLADVDDLQSATDANLQLRRLAIPTAEAIIGHEIAQFDRWWAVQPVAPVAAAFTDKLDEMRRELLAEQRDRLSEEAFQALDDTTRKLVKRIAAGPLEALHESDADPDAWAAWLCGAFKLDSDS